MLTTKKRLQVRLSGFKSKIDKEGMKRLTIDMSLVETKGAMRGELASAVEMLVENPTLDGTACSEKMEGVRLTFSSPATPETINQVFESTNLFGFTIGRERSQEAGSIEKETSGRITVEFKFSPRVSEGGSWALANVGDELLMAIEKAQGELPLEPADEDPDSQEARNLRIINEEAADAKEISGKKPRVKKAKKAKE